MPLQITIDAYSGRPAPTVTVDGLEAEELFKRLAPAKRVPPRPPTPRAVGPLPYCERTTLVDPVTP